MNPILKSRLIGVVGISRKSFLWLFVIIFLQFSILPSCKKNDTTQGPFAPDLKLVLDNLVSPLTVLETPDATKRLFVVDQIGKVWIVDSTGTKMPNPFIDISSKMVALNPQYDERGLLGFAFHPGFKTNGRFFVFYTAPPHAGGPEPGSSWDNLTRISEFGVSSTNPNQADISSEKVILEADHPQFNHNGGTIAFGPDGYLYISIGDGGNKDDVGAGHVSDWYAANVGGNGQDVYNNLMGNVLRIDVNSISPYAVPSDNPFVGRPGLDEIYAYGFRNPYRFSFDMGGTHQLFLGDAGQSLYEEVDIVTKGGNYGWNIKEGTHCFSTDNDLVIRPTCPDVDTAGNPLIDPVIEIKNRSNPAGGIATTVVGGNVYRGTIFPDFAGRYIFGIYSQTDAPDAKIYVATSASSGLWAFDEIHLKSYPTNLGMYLKGFGQGIDGEIYLATSGQQGPSGSTGKIFKLVAK